MSITVKNICKNFGSFTALDPASLEVPGGGLLALLGPSGSGKTTLLRVIAGLETADDGVILYEDEEVTHRSARERNVGFVFQHYALFRHMSVFENVAFALRVRGWKQAKVRERVDELLRLLHREIHCTTVLVTHDQEEAFEVADRVVVMNHGRIEQVGSPREVFERPASAFVMDFLGHVNVFQGRVQNGRAFLGEAVVPCPDYPHDEELSAAVYVRPHELDIEHAGESPASLAATVLHVHPVGAVVRVQLHVREGENSLNVELSPERCTELDLKSG